jgi:hypothetical protein
MPVELTVTLKTTETTYRKKFLIYEPFTMDRSDPKIQALIKETLEDFKQRPDDCDITVKAQIEG